MTEAVGQLTATFNHWNGWLVNPEYIRREQTITWQTGGRPMLSENVTFANVAAMAEARQYSFQLLADGSLFQLYYRYRRDEETLSDAVLAYYEGRAGADDQEDMVEPLPSAPSELARWLRIDFNSSSMRCSLHNDCHMHISGFSGTRIPLDGVPTPKQFVDLVIAWCYPEIFAEHCLNGGARGVFRDERRQQWVHENSFPFIDDELFRQVIHVTLPRR